MSVSYLFLFIIMSHYDCASSSSLCQHSLKSSCICSPFLSQSNCSQRCFLSSWRMIDLTSTAALELWNLFSRPNHSSFKEQIMFKRSSKHSVLVSSSAESTWISNHFISFPYTWWEYDGVSASWKPKVFPKPRLSPVASAPSMGTSPGKHWWTPVGPPFSKQASRNQGCIQSCK